MSADNKYKLLGKERFIDPQSPEVNSLYRIIALRDIPEHGVKKDDIGGLITKGSLSQEGSCWVDKNAVVAGINISIEKDAYVGGNAFILHTAKPPRMFGSTKKEPSYVTITDQARIIGDAFVRYSGDDTNNRVSGNAEISGNAKLFDVNFVMDNAVISGTADLLSVWKIAGNAHISGGRLCWMKSISDNVIIQDNVSIRFIKDISDNVVIKDNVQFGFGNMGTAINSNILGNTIISGNAEIFGNADIVDSTISDDVRVFLHVSLQQVTATDHAVIGPFAQFSNVVISDNASTQENVQLSNVTLSNSAQIGSGQKFSQGVFATDDIFVQAEKEIVEVAVASDGKHIILGKDKSTHIEPVKGSEDGSNTLKLLNEIIQDLDSYETDIAKLIRYPVMTDRTNSHTLKMIVALKKAQRLAANPSDATFVSAVHKLEEKFLKAESNAIKIASSLLSKDELKKAAKATDLFSIARDESAGDHERKVAFIQGFKQLEGVITVPEIAVDTFRTKLGLKELSM